MKELYKFFKYNGKVVDIENFNPDILNIFSRDVLHMIEAGETGWEELIPEGVATIIKDKALFGYKQIPAKASN